MESRHLCSTADPLETPRTDQTSRAYSSSKELTWTDDGWYRKLGLAGDLVGSACSGTRNDGMWTRYATRIHIFIIVLRLIYHWHCSSHRSRRYFSCPKSYSHPLTQLRSILSTSHAERYRWPCWAFFHLRFPRGLRGRAWQTCQCISQTRPSTGCICALSSIMDLPLREYYLCTLS